MIWIISQTLKIWLILLFILLYVTFRSYIVLFFFFYNPRLFTNKKGGWWVISGLILIADIFKTWYEICLDVKICEGDTYFQNRIIITGYQERCSVWEIKVRISVRDQIFLNERQIHDTLLNSRTLRSRVEGVGGRGGEERYDISLA